MQRSRFDEAVRKLSQQDRRFHQDGYFFLRDALDHTVNHLRREELEEHRHVSGPELLEGVVEFALKEYGSMAWTVFDSWGIQKDSDIGEMVFLLIGEGAFGQSEEDSLQDFEGVLSLEKRLRNPYRPSRRFARGDQPASGDGPPARGNQPANPQES
ncbi:MAG: Minf_1886 family protein [Verrucomicrobiota bacterium]